jgi:hypothetical protein
MPLGSTILHNIVVRVPFLACEQQHMYLQTLSHRVTGFANITTRQMLTHLYTTYGRLSPSDLIDNATTKNENTLRPQPAN